MEPAHHESQPSINSLCPGLPVELMAGNVPIDPRSGGSCSLPAILRKNGRSVQGRRPQISTSTREQIAIARSNRFHGARFGVTLHRVRYLTNRAITGVWYEPPGTNRPCCHSCQRSR